MSSLTPEWYAWHEKPCEICAQLENIGSCDRCGGALKAIGFHGSHSYRHANRASRCEMYAGPEYKKYGLQPEPRRPAKVVAKQKASDAAKSATFLALDLPSMIFGYAFFVGGIGGTIVLGVAAMSDDSESTALLPFTIGAALLGLLMIRRLTGRWPWNL
jgi:hypothetical protein